MTIYVVLMFLSILVGMAISVKAFGTGGKRAKVFEDIYFSVEDVEDIGIVYTKSGDYSALMEIENPVQKYSADTDSYYDYQQLFTKICQSLGEGYILQKQDVFIRKRFDSSALINGQSLSTLQQSYFRYFHGREYTEVKTVLIITQENRKSRLFSYDAKKWREFLDKLNKVRDQFHAEKLHVRFLNGAECQDYVDRYFAMNFRDAHYSMTNFKVDDEDILIGDFNCEQSLILQYYMLISKYCIDLMINSIIETLYLLIITFLSDMPGMKCKQYKKINEYFDPDIDFGIKQYVADYQAVYLTLDIETSLMWQSGIVAKWRLNENRTRLCYAEREPLR